MEIAFHEGHEFKDANGNLICRAARDIYPGEGIHFDQLKDWQVPMPKPGSDESQRLLQALKSQAGS